MPALPLDQVAASRAVAIYNELRLPDVAGKPRLAEAGGDWFREVLAAAHGSVDDTGLRHVREPFVLVPKKNSKTTNAGAAGLTAMLVESEPSQAYYIWGPTQEIADRAFAQAAGMIEADEETLLKRFHIARHLKTITDRKWDTVLKVSTFDEKVATGAIPKWALVEEIHILGKIEYASRVLRQVRGGMQTRPGALLWMITTQSDQPPAGVFKTELQFARAIRDGRISGQAATMLPLLYEFPEAVQRHEKEPWSNPAMWHQVLPNLGKSLRLDMLEADYAATCEKGEADRRVWLSQHLNIEVGLGLHTDIWAGTQMWQAAGEHYIDLDMFIARCEVVTAGVDGGGADDLMSLALIGRERGTGRWLCWSRSWAHTTVWDRRPGIASRLDDFVTAGDLIKCIGANADVTGMVAILTRVREAGILAASAAIGLDPVGVAAFVEALREAGFTDDQLFGVPQGFKLNGTILGVERKLRDGTLVHGKQPLLDWAVSNAKTEARGSAVLITKQVAGRTKIDPLIALLNAFALMVRGPEAMRASVYERRGPLIF
jgi:phage terminase large subunit-like protein